MRDQNRLIAIAVLSCLLGLVAAPATCEAGCLLDWLFQRNRSQGLANTRNSATNGLATDNRQSGLGIAPTTAGYAPASSCGPGFCQQTVVRWMPQVAYRTEYHPVPVTTYKTSSSINPANGLPLTCTRPCTTYTNQARRVPYTTYRPVYTTVPVGDPMASQSAGQSGQLPAAALAPTLPSGTTPPTSAFYPPAAYGYQPSATGCSTCQNGATGSDPGYGYYGGTNAPGYTPGNANLAPAPADYPPSLQRSLRPETFGYSTSPQYGRSSYYRDPRSDADVPGATPWRPVEPNSQTSRYRPSDQYRDETDYRADYYGSNASDQRATEWGTVPSNGVTSPPSNGYSPADVDPSLPQDTAPQRKALKPVPFPSSSRENSQSLSQGRQSIDDFGPITDQASDRMFSTPNGSVSGDQGRTGPSGVRPRRQAPTTLQPPANQGVGAPLERQWRKFDSAVPDLERAPQDSNTRWWDPDDKTANGNGHVTPAARASLSKSRMTRYAAMPIDWQAERRTNVERSAPNRQRSANPWVPR